MACDVTKRASEEAAREAAKRFGRLNVIVNNAGVLVVATWRISEEEWDQFVAINLKGTF